MLSRGFRVFLVTLEFVIFVTKILSRGSRGFRRFRGLQCENELNGTQITVARVRLQPVLLS